MVGELLAGTRYLLASSGVAATRESTPVAPPREEPVADLASVPAAVVKVDWQVPLSEAAWSVPLSFYEPVKAKKAAGGNFADFAPVKPAAEFDSMGRDLLGKGKSE